jgi:D-alanine-D-alanine ligase
MEWRPSSPHGRIAILAGGSSAEREVSLISGRCVSEALVQAGYLVETFDPAVVDLAEIPWRQFEACFIALHGGAGEDGRIQRRLDLLHVPYTGSGPAACRLAMSKSASKERFLLAGVPTPPYVLLPISPVAAPSSNLKQLGFPLIIKPDSQGSSLGLGVARDSKEVQSALAACRQLDEFAIAEPLIIGREFTVAVLGRQPLPLLEIIPPEGLFDYEAKYTSEATKYRFDTGLSAEQAGELERIAIRAAESLGTAGLCRVDLMLDHDGRPWVLEVNTVPGMTDHSLAPLAARRAGWDMPRFCEWMLQQCRSLETLS